MTVIEQRNLSSVMEAIIHPVNGPVSYLKGWQENQQRSRKAIRSATQTERTEKTQQWNNGDSTGHRQEIN